MILSDNGATLNRYILHMTQLSANSGHPRHRAVGIASTPYSTTPATWFILFDEREPTVEVRKYPLYPDNWRLS